jgi:coenzyme F420-reducing hydrogenase alpha subunit
MSTTTPAAHGGAAKIHVETIARVEGEGALNVRLKGGRIQDLRLEIPEPPRLFEAFLRGRRAEEAVDITARICGICPIAYQMSATHAIVGHPDRSAGAGATAAVLLRRMD